MTPDEKKAKQREYSRNYYLRNKSARIAAARAWRMTHPEANREHQRRNNVKLRERGYYRERYREKLSFSQRNPERFRAARRAKNKVQTAIRNGTLTRPPACEQCGLVCKPDAAHADYSLPLEVRWLCRPCHSAWDRHQPKTL